MTTPRPSRQPRNVKGAGRLMVRLDQESKATLKRAAALRGISLSAYVRQVAVVQARTEVLAARERTLGLTPQEQLDFWNALNEPVRLTEAQRRLGATMRGKSGRRPVPR